MLRGCADLLFVASVIKDGRDPQKQFFEKVFGFSPDHGDRSAIGP
jgi:hypothetical protein